jgi:hypothetical protein
MEHLGHAAMKTVEHANLEVGMKLNAIVFAHPTLFEDWNDGLEVHGDSKDDQG